MAAFGEKAPVLVKAMKKHNFMVNHFLSYRVSASGCTWLREGPFLAFCLFLSSTTPQYAQASDVSATSTYRLSITAVKCLIAHQNEIEKLDAELLILDISKCPPLSNVDLSRLIGAKDSLVPVGEMGKSATDYASLLFIPRNEKACFLKLITDQSSTSDETISIDFAPCIETNSP